MRQATDQAQAGANDNLNMSPDARARMRKREVDVFNYYDDGGPGRGHCTWGQVFSPTAGRAPKKN
jgi:hypothetical protein